MKTAALFVYVWPEPQSSAAGVRTVELCQNLRSLGYNLSLLSPCKENAASATLNAQGFTTIPCPANDSSMEEILAPINPSLVVYDRFVMEEQFGWRARALWPQAFHLVDTQDIHTVRRARERMHSAGNTADEIESLQGANFSPDLERELSSLYRSDACLVVSAWEREWLIAQGYPAARVCYLPFGALPENSPPPFSERRGFAFLGNFRHPPNLDAVHWLRAELWPELRLKLPTEKLYLYGSYPPLAVSQMHGKNGIEVIGPIPLHREHLKKHRVLLAPLRFGAGIKGKVLEAWACGTPVVGTKIAFEGLRAKATRAESFVSEAAELHESEEKWLAAQIEGNSALTDFLPASISEKLRQFLIDGYANLQDWREDIVGRMLRHHLHNSTKYFSQWIEAKNKK